MVYSIVCLGEDVRVLYDRFVRLYPSEAVEPWEPIDLARHEALRIIRKCFGYYMHKRLPPHCVLKVQRDAGPEIEHGWFIR